MPKTEITSSKIPKPSGHFSQATSIAARGRFVFISGMTARCADGTIAGIGDIEVQTQQVCENIKAAVEQAGGTMDDICRVLASRTGDAGCSQMSTKWRARRDSNS
jgi:2-iminobutanoate/2-iminopropanoate deaminase